MGTAGPAQAQCYALLLPSRNPPFSACTSPVGLDADPLSRWGPGVTADTTHRRGLQSWRDGCPGRKGVKGASCTGGSKG